MNSTDPELLNILSDLEELLKQRRQELPKDSYTSDLFRDGVDKIAQKVGEEAVEVVIAAKNSNENETVAESADLIFHLLVLLVAREIPLEKVLQELKKRRK